MATSGWRHDEDVLSGADGSGTKTAGIGQPSAVSRADPTPLRAGDALWQTLTLLTHAARYRTWIVSCFRPYIGRHVLEVGCGLGDFVPFLHHAEQLVLLDPAPAAIRAVTQRWGKGGRVHAILGDITDSATVERLAARGPFDTVLFVNVLEHIEEDGVALRHARAVLVPGGHVLIYAPAHPALYGTLDAALGHHRRYTRAGLLALVRAAGFSPLFCRPVNLWGAAAWWFDGRVRRYTVLPPWQVRVFDMLVPILRPVEHVLRLAWPTLPGLSLACVGRAPG